MCAYKMAPFQTRTLSLLLEHVGGYPSITSVLKEDCFCSKKSWMDVHGAVISLRNVCGTRSRLSYRLPIPLTNST